MKVNKGVCSGAAKVKTIKDCGPETIGRGSEGAWNPACKIPAAFGIDAGKPGYYTPSSFYFDKTSPFT
jgi:hypothetical protein